MNEKPDMEKVWARIEQIATTGYLQEDRILRLEADMAEWFERITPIVEENVKGLTELRKLVESYIRGVSNGGSQS